MESKRDFLSLSELIINMRKEKGYSQRKFAQISGLSNTTISRIENGETLHPDVETLKLLATHLGISEAELIKAVNYSKGQEPLSRRAKLNFYKQPVRKIKRYSSVFSSAPQPEEPRHEEEKPKAHEQQPLQKPKEAKVEKPMQKVTLKGMRLITLRLEKNITQKELADALGLDKTLISQYEGEIIKPDFDTVEKLAQYFGVTLGYLSGVSDAPVEVKAEPSPPIKEYAKEETAAKISKEADLKPEYALAALEAQKAGIDPEDIRNFIEMVKRYKKIL